jgi:hypothetical protein
MGALRIRGTASRISQSKWHYCSVIFWLVGDPGPQLGSHLKKLLGFPHMRGQWLGELVCCLGHFDKGWINVRTTQCEI